MLKLNPAKKTVLALVAPLLMGTVNVRAQTPVPKFEVSSIRLSQGCIGTDAKLGPPPGGMNGPIPKAPPPPRAGGIARSSPGRLNECHSLADLIHMAYVMYAGGTFHGAWGPQFEAGPPLEGGPAWVRSDTYEVVAKPESAQPREMMSGPMLQALLEDRFKLKLHRDTRDVPVYVLTVAKGGFKLQPSKVNCVTVAPRQPGDPIPPLAPDRKYCMDMIGFRKGLNTGLNASASTLDHFAMLLGHLVDRPVVDKTGIAGKFDIHLEFAIDESTPRFLPGGDMSQTIVQPSTDPAGPSIFTVVQQQLGLKLEPVKGPGDFLVIDHVERPSAN